VRFLTREQDYRDPYPLSADRFLVARGNRLLLMDQAGRAPRTIGSAASGVMKKMQGGHHGVKVPPDELRTVRLWPAPTEGLAGNLAATRG